MNRIQAYIPPGSHSSVLASIDPAAIQRLRHREPAADFFRPLHYEFNYAYPLVVWLHGAGGSEQNLAQVLSLISMRNYVGAAVRGTCAWDHGFSWDETATGREQAAERVLATVDSARDRFHVHPERIFLMGYRSGGTLAVRLALQNPELFAGAVSLSGRFPQGQMPLARLQQARKLSLLLTHGRNSRRYSVDHVCEELPLFHAAGMKVDLRQYPCGDELTTKMLSDVNHWLMSRITGSPITVDDEEERACEVEWN